VALKYIVCNKRDYSDYCVLHKPRKRISQFGKEAERYTKFRDEVAIPYLDKTFGHKCRVCGTTNNLDVDHINKRSTHPELKYQLSNLQYLCRKCHQSKEV